MMATEDLDTATAALRLQTAVDELTQPGVVKLQRDIPHPGTTAWQLAADDKALEEDLQQQLVQAAALARRSDEQLARADEQIHDGEEAGDDALVARAAQLADDARRGIDRATTQAERAHEALEQLHTRRAARTRTEATMPSLLDQLLDEIPNSSDSGGGRSSGGSRSPLALAALDAAQEIATAVGQPLDDRLPQHVRAWADDAHRFEELLPIRAEKAAAWPDRVRGVLNPTKPWRVAGRCPDCGKDTAWVEKDGETVRLPAIELDRSGPERRARCLCCRARWVGDAGLASLEKVLNEQRQTERVRLTSSREGSA